MRAVNQPLVVEYPHPVLHGFVEAHIKWLKLGGHAAWDDNKVRVARGKFTLHVLVEVALECIEHKHRTHSQVGTGPFPPHTVYPIDDQIGVHPPFFVGSHNDILRKCHGFRKHLPINDQILRQLVTVRSATEHCRHPRLLASRGQHANLFSSLHLYSRVGGHVKVHWCLVCISDLSQQIPILLAH